MDQPINLNPSPKQRFVSDPNLTKAHLALISRQDLESSIDAALRHYQLILCTEVKEANAAAAAHFKMTGALEFIHQFKYLAIAAPPAKKADKTGLDYSAQ